MSVSVRDARSSSQDREWIRAVYRDYLTELSASKTGLFPVLGEWDDRENEFLAGWFADPSAHPFVILSGSQRVGFALVAPPPVFPRTDVQYRMAEFFIVGDARRRGVGASAAWLLFNRFAGHWEVLEDEHNVPALQFWRRVITRQTSGRYSETRGAGEVRHRFRTEAHPSGV
ncbi:MAG TPA: GNAT family N-acetyltransferase [Steroidobacteraceae bacterium]|nr:GNAT family N-acetyltransferase [Steroidobacteraceae bacterium]